MGNTNCVADGGTPHRSDILICNQTDLDLHLDKRQSCQRECDHKGYGVTNGKIVKGCEPPNIIKANSVGRFSVSGRRNDIVPPAGKVFYRNENADLEVCIAWSRPPGWTRNLLMLCTIGALGGPIIIAPGVQHTTHLSGVIEGKPPEKEKSSIYFRSKPAPPWHEILTTSTIPAIMEITKNNVLGKQFFCYFGIQQLCYAY